MARSKTEQAGHAPGDAAAERRGRAADSVERVYAIIKELAIEYRFRPGQKINEAELAAQLSVSRTPVRAALNRLERDGFVLTVPNKGFHAREITPDALRDLYELRAAVERAAFVLACQRASERDMEATIAAWERHNSLAEEGSWAKIALADEAFHMALTRLSQNEQLALALESVASRLRFFRRIALEALPQRAKTYQEHAAIIDALRRRDAAAGAALIEQHITLSSAHAMEVATRGLARIFFGSAA
ncbi:GntR family transcriptional regulator [Ancylobacter sp. Lp-2]|uniref:GntR family transcriptional regulator n=1 Tax=Ancylobacter sp. Lp-2 TaxID=2881339 RepID=UPI001E57A3B0|nr:GntR family transcriptional regulator [Ancylobacter sp. Lp-2]MCB4767392.1 GntR family transcriptional regulator [Ancylobacter sp. Lp-2]